MAGETQPREQGDGISSWHQTRHDAPLHTVRFGDVHLLLSHHGGLQVSKSTKTKTANKEKMGAGPGEQSLYLEQTAVCTPSTALECSGRLSLGVTLQ